MFHFPAYPPHTAVPAHDGRWVPPFGNPRIKALLAAPRGISQPQTSFIGPVCQGIHHTPLQATRTTRCAWPQGSFLANSQTTNHHTKMITKRSKQTLKNRVRFEINSKNEEPKGNPVLLASTIQFSSHHAPPRRPDGTSPPSGTMGIESRQAKAWGGDPGAQKRIRTTPAEHPTTDEPKAHDLFHTSSPRPPRLPRRRGSHAGRTSGCILRRKEVIQPHLPVRLPCYDLVPITSLTLDGSLPQGVRPPASGAAHFHDLTGGVYKARERIHRDVADSRLLATPPSRSRVADCDPN